MLNVAFLRNKQTNKQTNKHVTTIGRQPPVTAHSCPSRTGTKPQLQNNTVDEITATN